ncbi:MAG: diacylglycerol kinase family protein [Clostridia bacterium]|nr:diacylglycerol kinase family protein [Clostridia bacterium]
MAFFRSFKYAFFGVMHCIKTQRNFRFHTFAALSAMILAYEYNLSQTEKLVLMFTIVFVLISEMFNTAIESVVDMKTQDYNPLAKIAKDVAAGSVLVSAFAAATTGLVLFYNDGVIWQIVFDYIKNPLFWLYAAAGLVYISGILFREKEVNTNGK